VDFEVAFAQPLRQVEKEHQEEEAEPEPEGGPHGGFLPGVGCAGTILFI
jgi:hypothetical protein